MGRKIKKVIMIAAFGMVTGGQIADLLPEGNVMQVEAGSRKQIRKMTGKIRRRMMKKMTGKTQRRMTRKRMEKIRRRMTRKRMGKTRRKMTRKMTGKT